MLHLTVSHCPQVLSTNVCSSLSGKTFLPQIADVQNELIYSVFVSFVLFECFYKYFVVIQLFFFLCNQCECAQVNLRRYDMQSLSAKVGCRVYHVYRGNNWTNLVIHQSVPVSIETNAISKTYDSCCCKITITGQNR